MALPRSVHLLGRSFLMALILLIVVAAGPSTASADAVTASGDEAVPASRLPVCHATTGSASRTSGTPARGTMPSHRVGDAQPATPRS